MPNNYTQVNAGTLVYVREVGVYLHADFNEDDGGRPYVTVDTSELPAHWRYDEKTKLRADAEFPDPYKNDDGSYTVFNADGTKAAVVYQLACESDVSTRWRAEKLTEELAREWDKGTGMPVISVHLNDGAEVYDDEGEGNTAHLAEQVVERLRRMTVVAELSRDQDDARWEDVTQDTEEAEQSGAIAGRAEALREVLEMLQNGESK